MQIFFRGPWWVGVLLLAVGCQSKRATFSFRPPKSPALSVAFIASAVPAAPAPTVPLAPVALAANLPAAAVSGTAAAPVPAAAPAITLATTQTGPQRPKQAAARFRQPAGSRASRPETAARTTRADTLHWVLGAALVAVGVVAGILLGGWLGLGVGAALVLLGYYFVLKALGGSEAWLEVFQEFFNM